MNYAQNRHLYIGFHGCEKSLAYKLLLGQAVMQPSHNDYDWLGAGCYFWENDPKRALEFAREVKHCDEPFVIGAILDLGYCLDLTCRENTELLRIIYENLVNGLLESGKVKSNKFGRGDITGDLLLRYLDCATIEALHKFNQEQKKREYDSVRAGFWEGKELYKSAGFREKNHIQLCIRNSECILGLFLPMAVNS